MLHNILGNTSSAEPICYFLIGPPASGKSTYRENLIRDMIAPPVIISGDDMIEEECQRTGLTYREVFPKVDFKEQKRVLNQKFAEACRNQQHIVVDRTNLTIKGRRSFLANLPRTYRRIAIVFGYDAKRLFERLDERGARTGKTIPHHVVTDMLATYQPPGEGEFDQVINYSID